MSGAWSAPTRTCPRLTSISSVRVMVTDWPAPASPGEGAVALLEGAKATRGVATDAEFVARQPHVADAHQRPQVAVAAGRGEDPPAGVGQDHRHIGGRRPGHHVAGVLLVAGR